MDVIVKEWAGTERQFRLPLGRVMDLEQATDTGIGALFFRVVRTQWKVGDIYHTIRLALIGGGMEIIDAERLMKNSFEMRPYMENATLASEILSSLMSGVEEGSEGEGGTSEPMKFSEISQICRVFHMSPQELRDMSYADFINMVKGFNAGSDKKAPHLTEEEFLDILNRYEPEVEQ